MKFNEVTNDQWLSVAQVCEVFGVSDYLVKADIKANRLPHVQFGNRYLVPGWAVINKLTGELPEELPAIEDSGELTVEDFE